MSIRVLNSVILMRYAWLVLKAHHCRRVLSEDSGKMCLWKL